MRQMIKILTLLLVPLLLAGCSPAPGEETLPPTATALDMETVPPSPSPAPTRTQPQPAPPEPTSTPADQKADQGNADVTFVEARQAADGSWSFAVTVAHPDTGWEDYADGWDVVTPDGTVIKAREEEPFTRLLLHPHVEEQPFTRSQSGLRLPEGVDQVRVRAHDLADGWGGREITVDLTAAEGEGYVVIR